MLHLRSRMLLALLMFNNYADGSHEVNCYSIPGHPIPKLLVIGTDWTRFFCSTVEVYKFLLEDTVNVRTGMTVSHHPAFQRVLPWTGVLQKEIVVDFLGLTLPRSVYCSSQLNGPPHKSAASKFEPFKMRVCWAYHVLTKAHEERPIQTQLPVVSQTYFEYVDILEAATAFELEQHGCSGPDAGTNGRSFTVMDLGSTYGHWALSAHRALAQTTCFDAPRRLFLVDARKAEASVIEKLAHDNDVMRDELYVRKQVYVGYRTDKPFKNLLEKFKDLKITNLKTLFDNSTGVVDLLKLSVLGPLYDAPPREGRGLLSDPESLAVLGDRVKRISISANTVQSGDVQALLKLYTDNGWRLNMYYELGHSVETPFGPVRFRNGIVSLVNRRFEADINSTNATNSTPASSFEGHTSRRRGRRGRGRSINKDGR